MKITKKNLENIIEEEITKLFQEQGIAVGQADKLPIVMTMPRPEGDDFGDEPVATYVLQRVDSMLGDIEKALVDLNTRVSKLETPAVANQPSQIQEFTNEPDPGQRDLDGLRRRFTVTDKAKTGFDLDRTMPRYSGEDYSEVEAYMSQRLVRVVEMLLTRIREEFEIVYSEIESLRNRVVEPDDPEDYPSAPAIANSIQQP